MNHEPASSASGPGRDLSRRRFLALGASAAVVGAAGFSVRAAGSSRASTSASSSASAGAPTLSGAVPAAAAQSVGEPILISIQLEGGLDSLNTVVPLGSGRYRDLRQDGAIDESNVDRLDDSFGLFAMPFLADQWDAGNLALVHGVGRANASLSHFDETDIWEKGSVDQTTRTGWMWRSLDAIGGGAHDPLIGLSVESSTPALMGPTWSAATFPASGELPWVGVDDWERSLYNGVRSISEGRRNESPLVAQVRRGQSMVFDIAEQVGNLSVGYEDGPAPAVSDGQTRYFEGENDIWSGGIGRQLRLIAGMINQGVSTRMFHASQGGYDTHGDQWSDHPRLLLELDHAIREFFEVLAPGGPPVVIATWSEFGRRPEWNGSGTDHGTAGTYFVIGSSVRGGHHGEPVSLDNLDRDDNFIPTVDFRSYLGGLIGGVLDIDPATVIESPTSPMELIR